MPGDSATI